MTKIIKQKFNEQGEQRKDCFFCCVAMAIGVDYDHAWKMLPDHLQSALSSGRGVSGGHCDEILTLLGWNRLRVRREASNPTDEVGNYFVLYLHHEDANLGFVRNMLWGRRALLQVRSKNYASEMHIIYWDGHALLDPSNSRVYQWPEVEPIYLWLFDERCR